MTNPVHEFAQHDAPALTKEARFGDFLKDEQFKNIATRGAIAAATPFAMLGAFEGYDAIKGAIQKSRGYKKMVQANPELREVPADRLKLMYNSVYTASPTVAGDPLAAGSVVGRMAEYGGKVDPKTISELASSEQRMGKQLSPFRQNMITSVSGAMTDGLIDPLTAARIAESKASTGLKEKEFKAFDNRLQREEEAHKLRGDEFNHRKGVDLANAYAKGKELDMRGEEIGLKQDEFGQRKTEFEHRKGIDAQNVSINRRNANEQERHNLQSEVDQRANLRLQARGLTQKKTEFGALQNYRNQQQQNWKADRGIDDNVRGVAGYRTSRDKVLQAEAEQAGQPHLSASASDLVNMLAADDPRINNIRNKLITSFL